MAINFDYAPGATPLDPDEVAGLIPSHIANHAQLNEWEMVNILEGEHWAFSRKRRFPPIRMKVKQPIQPELLQSPRVEHLRVHREVLHVAGDHGEAVALCGRHQQRGHHR